MSGSMMSEDTALYTFQAWHNTTYALGKMLEARGYPVYFFRNTSRKSIQDMCAKYRCVVGMGDFMRRAKRIRIERHAVNRYGKGIIIPEGKERYLLYHDFAKNDALYLSSSNTNGRCNRAAYIVASLLPKTSRSAFLHIPRGFDLDHSMEIILQILKDISS